jgi:DNA invertase Pin-like site-specific DNA recombinase
MSNSKKIIGYIRVSTDKQGRSGLGLEGQEEALQAFARNSGGLILKTYREVESGKKASNRPELLKALGHAKRAGATLVIAKLDRLARNMAFVANLMDSGADFACCDNPHANRLTMHILAAVAEDEAKRISERTRAALAAYKRRGGKLGASRPECRNLTQAARKRGARRAGESVSRKADEAYADLAEAMTAWRQAGLSQQAIADKLNEQGHTTRRGKPWSQVQVMRVLQRFA